MAPGYEKRGMSARNQRVIPDASVRFPKDYDPGRTLKLHPDPPPPPPPPLSLRTASFWLQLDLGWLGTNQSYAGYFACVHYHALENRTILEDGFTPRS